MRQRTDYEWTLEHIDEHGDVIECDFAPTLEALAGKHEGLRVLDWKRWVKHQLDVGISRRVFACEDHPTECEGDDLEERQYVYFMTVHMDGTRTYTGSTHFGGTSGAGGGGPSIPKKYLSEFKRWRSQ